MTRSRLSLCLLLVMLVAALCVPSLARADLPSAPVAGIVVTASDAGGIEIVCTPPPWTLTRASDGQGRVSAPGWPQVQAPGQEELPYQTALVALPAAGEPSLSHSLRSVTSQALPAPLRRAEAADASEGAMAPPAPLAIEEIAIYRGARLARLACRPFWTIGDTLYVADEVRGRIAWPATEVGSQASPDSLAALAADVVLNPEQLRWQSPMPDALTAQPSGPAPAASAPRVYFEVSQTGLYRLDYTLLSPWGFAGANPARLRLWQGATELPLAFIGDGDGIFGAGDAAYFYVEPRPSRWQAADVLFFEVSAVDGLRMATRSGAPEGPAGRATLARLIEKNLLYSPESFTPGIPPGRDGDRWFWLHLQNPGSATAALTFDAADADTAQPAQLTLWLVGQTTAAAQPDHRMQVLLNGAPLGDIAWDGRTAISATLSVEAGLLRTAGNALSLQAPGLPGVTVDGFWLDALVLRALRANAATSPALGFAGQPQPSAYAIRLTNGNSVRAADVTDPLHPQWLTGAQVVGDVVSLGDGVTGGRSYWVTNGGGMNVPHVLHMPHDPWLYTRGVPYVGADLVIIAHPDFISALAPLVAHRQGQELQVAVVNVQGLYDAWGDGRVDPEAIRRFLRDAYSNWNPRPSTVLLVGDGSYDPRGYDAGSSPTFLPPYLADVDPWGGETAADNRYACVDGDDALADLAIGRWPVTTSAQTSALVAKLITYEAQAPDSAWAQRVLLVADDADQGGDFPAESDAMATRLPYSLDVTLIDCHGADPLASDCSVGAAATLRQALLTRWAEGALLIEYTGHSSWQQWAVERFLHLDDAPTLGTAGREPIVAGWTCFTGAFHRPDSTLDETLMLRATGGAIATWGPTGLGATPAHSVLAEGLHGALVAGGMDLGQATMLGKLNLWNKGPSRDLLDTFALLGDPALRLPIASPEWTSRYMLPILMGQGQLP